MQKEYKKSLCESYQDFAFIWDEELGVYVVSNHPVEEEKDTVFVNISDANKKDSLQDVIDYIDDYYNSTELAETGGVMKEDLESLNKLYGDIFTISLVNTEGADEFLEFTSVVDAQDYFDKLKIDNDRFFKKATLKDADGNELDVWEFEEDPIVEKKKKQPSDDEKRLDEDVVEEVEENDDIVEEEFDAFSVYLREVIASANTLANNLKVLHWYSSGETFDAIHALAEEYHNKVCDDFDFFVELALEFNIPVENPSHMESTKISVLEAPNNLIGFSLSEYYSNLIGNLTEYVDLLYDVYAIDNVGSDVVSEIDTIIRYWRKENFYKNARRSAE